ncbi:MAG: hypothetical protein KJ630_24585 [Proteobacteria bacterium]|nr:hypothetical protein [Pseudomonadota bacterium]
MKSSDADLDIFSPKTVSKPVKYIIYSHEQAFRHMTSWRSDKEQSLYMITDEVLFNVWDALSLSIDQEHREVYLPYLPHVFDLLTETEDGNEICDYLTFIEETKMGAARGDTLSRRRARLVVNILMEYRTAIFAQPESTIEA